MNQIAKLLSDFPSKFSSIFSIIGLVNSTAISISLLSSFVLSVRKKKIKLAVYFRKYEVHTDDQTEVKLLESFSTAIIITQPFRMMSFNPIYHVISKLMLCYVHLEFLLK